MVFVRVVSHMRTQTVASFTMVTTKLLQMWWDQVKNKRLFDPLQQPDYKIDLLGYYLIINCFSFANNAILIISV